MASRTFGWVQNPNRLDKLKFVVAIFKENSEENKDMIKNRLPLLFENKFISISNYNDFVSELSKKRIVISYEKLKGKGSGSKKRRDALCSGIIQAAIDAHSASKEIKISGGRYSKIKKPYTDDWTADGYLRWAISTGLLDYNVNDDTCQLSELGNILVTSKEGSEEEVEAFTKALLSYPPVYRVLEILSDKKQKTKFEIGSQLGFKGELGFTSIPQEVFVYDLCTETNPRKKSDIRSNVEGDSDKYARTICNWLVQMGWLEKGRKRVVSTYFGVTNEVDIMAWSITREGEKAIAKSKGYSSNPQIPKIVKYEMLATKVPNANFIRLRRAIILNILKYPKTIEQIQGALKCNELNEGVEVIKDEINNFRNIGIRIEYKKDRYRLIDKITALEIPAEDTGIIKDNITALKDTIRSKLYYINHDYLVLVDLAYSDAATKAKKNSDAKDFEIQTTNLLTKELEFKGERLGDSNKPDVIIYYDKFGTIIDNKSYKNGFTIDAHCKDEMSRYIEENQQRVPGVPSNEWWRCFDDNIKEFTFLFITSYLKGNFKNSLEYISKMKRINGGAIGVHNLLYLAEELKSNRISYYEFFTLFNNDEIKI